MVWIFFAVLIPSLVSLAGTEAVRRYAVRTHMMDVPNHRSSHTIPTPRGGGVAIAVSILLMLLLLILVVPSQRETAIGILGGSLAIAAVGLLDDRFNLSAKSRLIVQFAAAFWFLAWIGGVQATTAGSVLVGTAWVGPANLLAAFCLVWCTNLYNFMDGLDGFAGGQALVASLAAAMICLMKQDVLLTYLMLATAGAAAGFLVWNWPPAKIFMGDCGSGFLGFLFGATVLAGSRHGSISFTAGLTLIIVFLGDSTLTLLRRIGAGEAWYQPHRSHAYQLATQLGASHQQVTVTSLVAFGVAGCLALGMSIWSDFATALFLGYAIVLCAVWLLINFLIIGRRQVLATITSQGREAIGGPPPHSTGTNRLVDSVTSPATSLYLRFRCLLSRGFFLGGRSTMKNDLLSEATGVASDLGYHVSHDWLDGCGGGRCEVAGEKWILLDFNMSKQDQVKQIILAIHEEMDRAEAMSDELRSAVDRTAKVKNRMDDHIRRAA